MNVELLSAVKNGTEFVAHMPCGATLTIPGEVLQGWAVTPASAEFLSAAAVAMGPAGQTLKAEAGTFLDILMQLLPVLLPVLVPLITNSIKPTPQP